MSKTDDTAQPDKSPSRSIESSMVPSSAPVVICGGCGGRIADRYYFAAVGRRWHVSCLRCCVCNKELDATSTSYVRKDRIYCGNDFRRLFMVRDCNVCQKLIVPDDMVVAVVMTRDQDHVTCDSCEHGDSTTDDDRVAVYHARCFRCVVCGASRAPLLPGEQYGIDSGRIYCRAHFCELKLVLGASGRRAPMSPVTAITTASGTALGWLSHHRGRSTGASRTLAEKLTDRTSTIGCRTTGAASRGRPRKIKVSPDALTCVLPNQSLPEPQGAVEDVGQGGDDGPEPGIDDRKEDHVTTDVSDDAMHDDGSSSTGACGSWEEPAGSGEPTVRRKRMRSSFKHHQLKVMKAYFQVNHNPDAKELREMSMKTGLLTRVIQVWFQNARAKFRRNLSKQHQHHQPAQQQQQQQQQQQTTSSGTFVSEPQLHHQHHHPHHHPNHQLHEHHNQYDQYRQRRPTASASYIDPPDVDLPPGLTCGSGGRLVDAIACCMDMQPPISFGCRSAGYHDYGDAPPTVPEVASGFIDYGTPSAAIAAVTSDFYFR